MHRELFGDDNEEKLVNPISTRSQNPNLIQRKHEQGSKMFVVNAKEIDSITRASTSTTERFNEFAPTNRVHKAASAVETSSPSLSILQSLKSFFKCTATTRKINEQIELNYPLNLHLRMNQIFAMHDKLCETAEGFNDLYSIGMSNMID